MSYDGDGIFHHIETHYSETVTTALFWEKNERYKKSAMILDDLMSF